MRTWAYAVLGALLVAAGLVLALADGDRSIVAGLLLLGCLSAFAQLTNGRKR